MVSAVSVSMYGYSDSSSERGNLNTLLYPIYDTYIYAETQLTNLSNSSLGKNVTAYGNNGIFKGDGSVYNTIPLKTRMETIFGLTPVILYNPFGTSVSVYNFNENFSSYAGNTVMKYLKESSLSEPVDSMNIAVCFGGKIGGYQLSNDELHYYYYVDGIPYVVILHNSVYTYTYTIKNLNTEETINSGSVNGRMLKIAKNRIFFNGSFSNNNILVVDGVTGNIVSTITPEIYDDASVYFVNDKYVILSCYDIGSTASSCWLAVYNIETDELTDTLTVSGGGHIDGVLKTKDNVYIPIGRHGTSGYFLYKLTDGTFTQVYSTSVGSYDSSTPISRVLYGLEDDNYIYGIGRRYPKNSSGSPTSINAVRTLQYYDNIKDIYYSFGNYGTDVNATNKIIEGSSISSTTLFTLPTILQHLAKLYDGADVDSSLMFPINDTVTEIISVTQSETSIRVDFSNGAYITYSNYKISTSQDYECSILNGCSSTNYSNPILGFCDKSSLSATEYDQALNTAKQIEGSVE